MPMEKMVWTMLLLSALSGAVQALTPDHWIPASVVAWQRGWTTRRCSILAAIALSLHVLAGLFLFLVFWAARDIWRPLNPDQLFGVSLVLVALALLFRISRFQKLRQILLAGPDSSWGIYAVFTLLGPCEYLIPILLKSRQLGFGYLTPTLAVGLGTLLVGTGLSTLGRTLWNRPLWLPRSLHWGRKPQAMIPILTCLLLGLGAIFRLG